jgi:hypothetical protein
VPAERSNIVCPKCKQIGGFLTKRPVKTDINIPKEGNITDVSKAWDYAAKVYLRLRELLILMPPSPDLDEKIANEFYKNFDFISHDSDELKVFEARHLSTPAKNVKKKQTELTTNIRRTTERKDDELDHYLSNKNPPWPGGTIHMRLPVNSGRICKSSVSMLYAAIVCLILRDTHHDLHSQLPDDTNKNLAETIYEVHSVLQDDLRRWGPWIYWFYVFSKANKHDSYHAAINDMQKQNPVCKTCSIDMKEKIQSNSGRKYLCPKCGSDEPLTVRHRTELLFDIYDKAAQKVVPIVKIYLPIYDQIKILCKCEINENKEEFQRRFQDYEEKAVKGLLTAQYRYFVGHYDSAKNSKRWCSLKKHELALVEINDRRYYSEYKALINRCISAYLEHSKEKTRIFIRAASNLLKELGWPEQYINDKVRSDGAAVFSSIRFQLKKENSIT